MSQLPSSIGFPSGVFGVAPLRLDVLTHGPGWVALNKPVNLPSDDHPWQENAAHLVGELRVQLQLEKPEIVKLGLKEPAVAFGPEPQVSGLLILADRASTLAAWREAIGSFQLNFTYEFIARTEEAPAEGGLCDLPLGMDDTRGRAFVSHRLGKQAETTFHGGDGRRAALQLRSACTAAVGEVQPLLSTLNLELESAAPAHARAASA